MPATAKSYHVIPAPIDGWSVKKAGAHRATRHFDTKKSAVKWARVISRDKNTVLYVHRKDGRVAERYSYVSEPIPERAW